MITTVTVGDVIGVGVVHVAFGSNIRPEGNLVRALDALTGIAQVTATSPVYLSAPVHAEGSEFLNAVVGIAWPGSPNGLADLKDRLSAVEAAQGRRPSPGADEPGRQGHGGARWPARMIDLDIILAGDLVTRYGNRPWEVPHPDITRFAHVAVPLATLTSGPHPATGRDLAVIAADLAARADLRPVELAGWVHR